MNALHTYTYDYDGNGNVVDVMDDEGTSVAHYEYDPFGRTVAKSGTFADDNHWRFSTKSQDESGLYYYGYRYYSPELGRWPSRDPIGEDANMVFLANTFINLQHWSSFFRQIKNSRKIRMNLAKTCGGMREIVDEITQYIGQVERQILLLQLERYARCSLPRQESALSCDLWGMLEREAVRKELVLATTSLSQMESIKMVRAIAIAVRFDWQLPSLTWFTAIPNAKLYLFINNKTENDHDILGLGTTGGCYAYKVEGYVMCQDVGCRASVPGYYAECKPSGNCDCFCDVIGKD